MKYKIDTKVRVREDIKEHDCIDDMFVLPKMLKYRGEVLTINGKRGTKVYTFAELTEDENMDVFFTDHMLIPIPAPKHKVGDRVTVRKGMDTSKKHGGVSIIAFMRELGGKTFTIKEIDYTTFKVPTYRFEDEGCYWTDAMLDEDEDIEITDPMSIVENGNIVQVARGEYYFYLNGKGLDKNGYTLFGHPEFEIIKIWKIADSNIYSSYELINPKACKGELVWEKPLAAKEMTVSEIEKALGYNVKIVKEEGKYEF